MRHSFYTSVAVLLVIGLAVGGDQSRAASLDQEYAPGTVGIFTQFNARRTAQTFTAGRSGLLSAIEVHISQLDPRGNLVVEIHDSIQEGTINFPMSILGSTSIPLSSVPSSSPGGTGPAFVAIDLAQLGIRLSANHQYAISMHRDFTDSYSGAYGTVWHGGIADSQGDYSGGSAYFFSPAGDYLTGNWSVEFFPDRWIPLQGDSDLAFRTYVVPEPSSLALGGICVGIVVATLRARRNSKKKVTI